MYIHKFSEENLISVILLVLSILKEIESQMINCLRTYVFKDLMNGCGSGDLWKSAGGSPGEFVLRYLPKTIICQDVYCIGTFFLLQNFVLSVFSHSGKIMTPSRLIKI